MQYIKHTLMAKPKFCDAPHLDFDFFGHRTVTFEAHCNFTLFGLSCNTGSICKQEFRNGCDSSATHLSVYRNLAKTVKRRNMIKQQWDDHDCYKS
jgi:hypothetical protein